MKIRQICVSLALVLAVGQAHAALLSVSFTDAVGDANPDLIAADLLWESTTGDFTLDYLFNPAAPFIGTANFNLNMLNGDLDAADPDAFVTINRFNATAITSPSATTLITVTGTELGLTAWMAGDRIANNDSIFGLPIGGTVTAFQSAVTGDPMDASFAIVRSVPEPGTLAMLAIGLLGLAIARRRAV